MRQMTLYLNLANNNLTLFFTATSNNTPLFNGNGKVNREVLEKKRREIFSLPSASRGANVMPIIPRLLKKAGYVTYG